MSKLRNSSNCYLAVVLRGDVSEHLGAGEVWQGQGVPHPAPAPAPRHLALAPALVLLLLLLLDPPDRVVRVVGGVARHLLGEAVISFTVPPSLDQLPAPSSHLQRHVVGVQARGVVGALPGVALLHTYSSNNG